MERFTVAVRAALDQDNWYAALSLALLLPDICGRLECPKEGSQSRYVRWYNKWLLTKYSSKSAWDEPQVFLSGRDCYALRCAFSHEGREDVSEQRARDVLSRFTFNTPHPNISIHCNRINDSLQLDVEEFATDICEAVEVWAAKNRWDPEISSRMAGLVTIHDTASGVPEVLAFTS